MSRTIPSFAEEGLKRFLHGMDRRIKDLERGGDWRFDEEVEAGSDTYVLPSGWDNVVSNGTQASPDNPGWAGLPSDWDDGAAHWVWHTALDGSQDRPGGEEAWLQGIYNSVSARSVVIEFAVDNAGSLYLNGTLLGSVGDLGGAALPSGFDPKATYATTLAAGENQFTIYGLNATSGNHAASVLLSVSDATTGAVLFRTTDQGGWYATDSEPSGWPSPIRGSGSLAFGDLVDVDTITTAPTHGDVPTYDSARGMWEPAAPTVGTTQEITATVNGQPAMYLVPSVTNGDLVIYHHGAGEDETAPSTEPDKAALVDALLDAGYVIASIDAHGDNWGNQAAVDDYEALHSHAVTNLGPFGRVLYLAQSMGGLSALTSIQEGTVPVSHFYGIYPVANLEEVYADGGFTAAIETAYGFSGTFDQTATAGHDPVNDHTGSDYAGVEMRFVASPADMTVLKTENADAMAALVAGQAASSTVVEASGTHGDASHFDAADLIAFFAGPSALTAERIRDAGRWEVVVSGTPAEAVTTEDETDWLYAWTTG